MLRLSVHPGFLPETGNDGGMIPERVDSLTSYTAGVDPNAMTMGNETTLELTLSAMTPGTETTLESKNIFSCFYVCVPC